MSRAALLFLNFSLSLSLSSGLEMKPVTRGCLVYTVYRKSQLLTTSPLSRIKETKVFPPGLSTGFDIKRSLANWIVCPLESLIFASCCRPFNPQLRTITEPLSGRTESESFVSTPGSSYGGLIARGNVLRKTAREFFQRFFFMSVVEKEI